MIRLLRPSLAFFPLVLLAACGDARLGDTDQQSGTQGQAGASDLLAGGGNAGTSAGSAGTDSNAGHAGTGGGLAGSGNAGGGNAGGGNAGGGQAGSGNAGAAGSGNAGGQAGDAGGQAGGGQAGGGQAGGGQAGGGMAGGGMAGGGQAGGGQAGTAGSGNAGSAGSGNAGSGNAGTAGSGNAGSGAGGNASTCSPLPLGASWTMAAPLVPDKATLNPFLFTAKGAVYLLGQPLQLWKLENEVFVPIGGTPPADMDGQGISAAIEYDEANEELFLFNNKPLSGALGDTWTLSLSTLAWTKRCADCGVPLTDLGMAYDSARKRMVLVSRPNAILSSVTTSEWNGSSWEIICGSGQPACPFKNIQAASMAYDQARKISIFGATTGPDGPQTWEYDASQPAASRWTQRTAPPEGTAGNLRYDAARQRVTLPTTDKALEWDGACWYYAEDPQNPLHSNLLGLAYDPAGQRSLAIGNTDSNGYFLASRAGP